VSFHPSPIRTDSSNPFAQQTVAQRLPAIVNDVIQSNYWLSEPMRNGLALLRESLVNNDPIAPLTLPAPDYDTWAEDSASHAGARWQQAEWFYAEMLFFRHIIQHTRYFENNFDPYWPMKSRELSSDALRRLIASALTANGDLQHLLGFALWGNRIDLSHPAGLLSAEETLDEELLSDDRAHAIAQIERGAGTVHIITDNAGSELAMDLVLADALLARAIPVMLHMKMHPTYVSDATPRDLRNFIELLESGTFDDDIHGPAKAWGGRLRAAFNVGALRVAPDFYWNSPRWLNQLPPRLQATFIGARLVILKGDANYRRSTFDTVSAPDTPYQEVTAYFPHPLLALRTLKSDPVFGLDAARAARLDTQHGAQNWRVLGKYGVIQFKA